MRKAGKRIISLDEAAACFEAHILARKFAGNKGKLPSNVLLDEYLIRTDKYKSIEKAFPLWVIEFLVHPRSGGKFKKGLDVVDSERDRQGRRWVLPASHIPPYALEKEDVGLLVKPSIISADKDRVVIHPDAVFFLYPFIQEPASCVSGVCGKVEKRTGIPLKTIPRQLEGLPLEEKRWLFRVGGVGVRPLVRTYNESDDSSRYHIYANHSPDTIFGVTVEVSEMDPTFTKNTPTQLTVVRDGTKLIVSGTPEHLDSIFQLINEFNKDIK